MAAAESRSLYYTDLEITLFVNLVNEVTPALINGEIQAHGTLDLRP